MIFTKRDSSLLLRIRCDAKMSLIPLGEKYGCGSGTEAENLIRLAMRLDLNVRKMNV